MTLKNSFNFLFKNEQNPDLLHVIGTSTNKNNKISNLQTRDNHISIVSKFYHYQCNLPVQLCTYLFQISLLVTSLGNIITV